MKSIVFLFIGFFMVAALCTSCTKDTCECTTVTTGADASTISESIDVPESYSSSQAKTWCDAYEYSIGSTTKTCELK